MEKKRFKMYKSGKSWVIAPIIFFGLLGLGTVVGSQTVQADEVIQSEAITPVQKENETSNLIENYQDDTQASNVSEETKKTVDNATSQDEVDSDSISQLGEEVPVVVENDLETKTVNEQELLDEEKVNDNSSKQNEIDKNSNGSEDSSKNEVVTAPVQEMPVVGETTTTGVETEKKSTVQTTDSKPKVTTKSTTQKQVAPKAAAKKATIPIYRVYNPNSGEHLHTMNANERNHLVRVGWRDEGISMSVDGTGNQLFRLYNPNSGEHFYTLNGNERDNLKRHGWRYEGVAWKTPVKGLPMYRVFNPNSRGAGSHHYTMDVNEKNHLVKSGWRYEGISWYTSGGSKPVASYILLNAPFIDQQAAGFPMGCEAASLLQALQLKGYAKNYNLKSFIKQQPKSPNNNPNNGFSGDPGNVVSGVYHSIFAKPLANWGSKYGKVADISGYSVEDLKNELRKGNPVVVYVTLNFEAPRYGNYWWGKGINNAHIMTLDGFNEANQTYHVSDPNGKKGGKYWVSASKFEASYNTRRSAVVVR